jgi:hypothetical protein
MKKEDGEAGFIEDCVILRIKKMEKIANVKTKTVFSMQ